MITLPFLPDYQILLTDRHDGSFRGKEKVVEFLHSKISDKEIGFLSIAHGSHPTVWKDHVLDEPADAVISTNPDIAVSMVVGDCFPIIIIDQKSHAICMIHAGWRSLLQNIIPLTLQKMTQLTRSHPADWVAWIGPGIRACSNLTKSPPIQSLFQEWQPFVSQTDQGYSVDLVGYIRLSLTNNGLKDENVLDYGKCTYCEKESFFSHRRATLEDDENGRFIVSVYRK